MDATDVRVRSVRSVGPDTVALELDTPPEFDALPGHFVLLRATVDGEDVSRHYTLSSPGVDDTFEITVGVDPTGDLSPWLADREPGDAVTVEGPFGTVVYDPESGGDVVAIGGGPGVGPAVAVGEAASAAGNAVAVVYEDDQPAHQDRLGDLASGGADVTVVTEAGLEEAVRRVADRGEVFVFGFREFLDRVLPALEAAGVDPDDANVENFG
jgi:ferredoxin-NADP reductase